MSSDETALEMVRSMQKVTKALGDEPVTISLAKVMSTEDQ